MIILLSQYIYILIHVKSTIKFNRLRIVESSPGFPAVNLPRNIEIFQWIYPNFLELQHYLLN